MRRVVSDDVTKQCLKKSRAEASGGGGAMERKLRSEGPITMTMHFMHLRLIKSFGHG